jgi:Outer membrane lipoprotein carrier protein LolA
MGHGQIAHPTREQACYRLTLGFGCIDPYLWFRHKAASHEDQSMTLTRRLFTSLALCAALPASAQELSLSEVSAYFNALQTAQGGFTQINADGTISTGTIYIKRPGRMRFEYAAPDNSMVIAGGGQVAIFDPRSNTGPSCWNAPLIWAAAIW